MNHERQETMPSIFARGNKLHINYRLGGERIRKSTGLDDTPKNRKHLTKEVIPALLKELNQRRLGIKRPRLFREYAAEYLASIAHHRSYKQRLPTRKKVMAHFGSMRIDEITRGDIKRYLESLVSSSTQEPIKSSSKVVYKSMIKETIEVAMDDEVIDRNVAIGIKLPAEPKTVIDPFSSEEIRLLLDAAEGIMRNYIGFVAYQGLRAEEALGFMRSSITDTTITIERAMTKGVLGAPKTQAGYRTIPLFDVAKPFIKDQLRRSTGLFLFDIDGKPISDIGVLRKRKWHRIVDKAGIRYRSINNLRHTFITAMLNSGHYKLLDIARIVGHKSIQTLIDNYAGFIKDAHLEIDTSIDIFDQNGHTVDTPPKKRKSQGIH